MQSFNAKLCVRARLAAVARYLDRGAEANASPSLFHFPIVLLYGRQPAPHRCPRATAIRGKLRASEPTIVPALEVAAMTPCECHPALRFGDLIHLAEAGETGRS